MKKSYVAAALAALLFAGAAGYAVSQIVVPKVVNVGPADIFPDIVSGNPTVPTFYASAGQIAGVPIYANLGTLVTTNTHTFANGEMDAFGHAAGTLAAIGLTTEPNPTDGRRECFWLDQIVTTLTWTANTGQTIGTNVPATGAAKIPNCITFVAASSTWFGSE